MLSSLVLAACGLVLVLASKLVLQGRHRGDLSARAVSALLVGAAGAWCLARALAGPPVPWPDLLLPVGVALWIGGAMWRRRGAPMRRRSDWSEFERTLSAPPSAVHRQPWAGPPH